MILFCSFASSYGESRRRESFFTAGHVNIKETLIYNVILQ